MKKIMKFLILTVLFMPLNCLAATGLIDIYTSNKTPTIGNTFTVTVYCKSSNVIGTCEYTLSYDSSKVKFVSASDSVNCNGTYCAYYAGNKSSSKKFTFKAIANGSATISAKAYGMIDFDEKNMTTSVSPVTVNVSKPVASKPVTYSTNNNLSSLEVEGYTLNEKFNKDTTSYTLSVPSQVEEIKIKATKEDSKAKVNGTGNFNVSEGDNSFNVVVTSEKGTKKTYTIKVTVEDKNPIIVKVNNENYSVIKRKSSLKAPDNYIETTVMINDTEIPAFTSEITNYTLVGLKNKDGITNLYVYDDEKNMFTIFNELSFDSFKINVIDNDKLPIKDLEKETISINEISVDSYKLNNNYYLIYGKNLSTGKDNWYLYEKTENTIQLFNSELITEHELKLDKANELILVFSTSTLLMALLLLVVAFSKNKRRKKESKNKIDKNFLNYDEPVKKDNKNKKEKQDTKKDEEIIILDSGKDKSISKAKQAEHEDFKEI